MASASPLPDPSLDAEWQEWKRRYEKTYGQVGNVLTVQGDLKEKDLNCKDFLNIKVVTETSCHQELPKDLYYELKDEEGHRRMVWEENKKKIEEHNAEYEQGMASFCMGLNEFSDLTNDEFWETMTCSPDSILEDQEIINTHLFSDIPEFEDLTEENNIPEKDQPE